MKHLKIYEAFNTKNSTLSIKIATSQLDLIGCDLVELHPEYTFYDYEYEENNENDLSENEHDQMVNNLDIDKYWIEVIPHIQKWFDTDDHKENFIDSLPFIQNVVFEKIELIRGEFYLDMVVDLNPKEMIIFLLHLMDDSKFITKTAEDFGSSEGFVSTMPTKDEDIIKILEQSSYDHFWKLLAIIGSYYSSNFKPDDYSLVGFIRETMCPTLNEFQK